jgi:hypothetical protein
VSRGETLNPDCCASIRDVRMPTSPLILGRFSPHILTPRRPCRQSVVLEPAPLEPAAAQAPSWLGLMERIKLKRLPPIPIADSEPVSIVKPEPPVAAGQRSGNQARTTIRLGTQWSARSDVGRGMWCGGMSPIGSGARTRPVKGVVVDWATAESPAAGCGADHDRLTSLSSRSS